jgi:hypothetical protein
MAAERRITDDPQVSPSCQVDGDAVCLEMRKRRAKRELPPKRLIIPEHIVALLHPNLDTPFQVVR